MELDFIDNSDNVVVSTVGDVEVSVHLSTGLHCKWVAPAQFCRQ